MWLRRLASAAARSMQQKKVVVTSQAFDETYKVLTSAGLHVVKNQRTEPWSRDELISHACDAHAILAFMTDCCDRTLLDACPNLELIACALKGFDNFDIDLCAERGVAVTAVPDLLTVPTAELAVLLALGLGRRIREADHVVRSGAFKGWMPTLYGSGLAGAVIGIYGAGAVGRAVAERLKGFVPARLLYADPIALHESTTNNSNVTMDLANNLDDLLKACDLVFICTPLNPSTYHAINSENLSGAKPGMQLINISRGSCVDEVAVADALESGHLAGYAADVFEFEDWILNDKPDSIEARLLSHPKTLFSPHLGSAVTSARRDIEHAAAEEIIRWKKGEQFLYRVN
uniref:D-isomer specific 2-hydroxyacid dehydrogenase NAD-binding domain-containing protein n=1 Tax=Odontella aurita TaxID=265563 RepID=A0A7S4JD36_9STRA|mmetsp:Transcript_43575/g.132634  ORF Transcript_43575/g.132634 Transcript_43575/m.132634 type:complete len:346 (+) Transcript_43575:169-1206(+)